MMPPHPPPLPTMSPPGSGPLPGGQFEYPPNQWCDRGPSQPWLGSSGVGGSSSSSCMNPSPSVGDMRLVEMAAPIQRHPGPVGSMPAPYDHGVPPPVTAAAAAPGSSISPEYSDQADEYFYAQPWAPGSYMPYASPPPSDPTCYDPWSLSSPPSPVLSPTMSYSATAAVGGSTTLHPHYTMPPQQHPSTAVGGGDPTLSPVMNPLVYETPPATALYPALPSNNVRYDHHHHPPAPRLGLPSLPSGHADYPAPSLGASPNRESLDRLSVKNAGQFPFDDFLALTDEEVRVYAEDHVTSLYLQDALRAEFRNASQVSRVVDRLVPLFLPLSFHAIGNYVSQAVLEVSDMATFEQLLNTQILKGRALFDLCIHPHGTRAVQKLISEANVRYGGSNQLPLLGAIRVCCRELAVDANGCYVLLKILDVMAQSGWLLECLLDRFIEISCSQWGVITAKKVIERCPAVDRVEMIPDMQQHYPNGSGWTEHPVIVGRHTSRLLEIFVVDFVVMARHQYGNYAVQHILQSPALSGSTQGCNALAEISRILSTSIVTLSKDKYSSNCVELLLVRGPSAFARSFAKDLLSDRRLEELLWDTYGNYVLQKLLIVMKNRGLPEFGELVKALKPSIHCILKNNKNAAGSDSSSSNGQGSSGNSLVGRNYRVAKKLVAKFPELNEGFSKARGTKTEIFLPGLGPPEAAEGGPRYAGGFTATSTPSWEAACRGDGYSRPGSPDKILDVNQETTEDKSSHQGATGG
ncbi:pumilio domain member 4 [Perkinsus olseni]|nr:pumilio domain member 4 [Perkinsus olseni]